jgi:hypothetical protein
MGPGRDGRGGGPSRAAVMIRSRPPLLCRCRCRLWISTERKVPSGSTFTTGSFRPVGARHARSAPVADTLAPGGEGVEAAVRDQDLPGPQPCQQSVRDGLLPDGACDVRRVRSAGDPSAPQRSP